MPEKTDRRQGMPTQGRSTRPQEAAGGQRPVQRPAQGPQQRPVKKGKRKGFFSRLKSLKFSQNIGIDLGTATVLVYVQGKGIALEEPSVVAIDTRNDRIVAVGKDAQEMLGRTPGNIMAVRPLREGVISQYEVTLRMLQHFIRNACENMFFPPRVMICVPSGITDVEERAVIDAAREAGAQKVYLIEEPIAAAVGAGLNISSHIGNMVVDIGGGTTDIAVLALNGIVVSESIKIAGDRFDEAIIRYVRKKYQMNIGERTAEIIKKSIGAVDDHVEVKRVEVKGQCLKTGLPKQVVVSSREMIEALAEPITAILDAITSVIERTPPELLGDILKNGIVMTGGGSLLYGFAQLITRVTGIPTRVADDAVSCVAIGTGKSLDNLENLREGAINVSRERKIRL